MNTAVAVTDMICRTAVYLAGIGGFAYLAPHWLPRAQVTTPRSRAAQTASSGQAVLDGQAAEVKP